METVSCSAAIIKQGSQRRVSLRDWRREQERERAAPAGGEKEARSPSHADPVCLRLGSPLSRSLEDPARLLFGVWLPVRTPCHALDITLAVPLGSSPLPFEIVSIVKSRRKPLKKKATSGSSH
ncbi:hypothetical protein AAFF_G00154110 [Aldrovandia affinis]|uniref:Uncharacterized protein n=1 Tax=Aldrovandia affinis TaxID=143900 RepID=A0AAD7SZV7_9TELE|nr:hypothetical protein AAFF_G00154110 [Aldrovandia affinis]